MEKEYAKDYPIPFHNDVFFKYMLIGDDAGSALLRSRIIEEIYGLKVHETKVLNPELLPEAFWQTCGFGCRWRMKPAIFTIWKCRYPAIRRRNSCVFSSMHTAWSEDSQQGDEYTELKPFYQIIFMNDKPRDGGRMIRHYKVKDEDNQEDPTVH